MAQRENTGAESVTFTLTLEMFNLVQVTFKMADFNHFSFITSSVSSHRMYKGVHSAIATIQLAADKYLALCSSG